MTLSRANFERAGVHKNVLDAASTLHLDWSKLFALVSKYGPVVYQIVVLAGTKNWPALIALATTSAPGLIQGILDALGIVPPADVSIPTVE
jgi:hypothetical protein